MPKISPSAGGCRVVSRGRGVPGIEFGDRDTDLTLPGGGSVFIPRFLGI
ncbi:hypothetical protein J4G37_11215 [Microvirga sp. 3-52]|nr:hypothetical protein [Microvirga sp. 3-52]